MSAAYPATLSVQVSYSGLIRHVVAMTDETVDLAAGATMRDLLVTLANRHGEAFREMLFVGDKQLVPNAIVLLDGADVSHLRGLDTLIAGPGKAQVLVMNPASGGG